VNGFKVAAFTLAASLTNAGLIFGATVFHNGGLGECSGCHGKSTARNTQSTFSTYSSNNITMLKGSDPSSACLTCHEAPKGTLRPEGYYVATSSNDLLPGVPPVQLTPGGDFGWLKKNYPPSDGSNHGHNILAADFNYFESGNIIAPGGKYPGVGLTCISCHDPHGNYRRTAEGIIAATGVPIVASGSYNDSPDPDTTRSVGTYRLLAGKGYQPKYLSSMGDYTFKADPPAAVAPTSYNRTENSTDTRVAYGSGMSEWCMNCHIIPHGDSIGHRAGDTVELTGEIVKNYGSLAKYVQAQWFR
jgi:hypothetical protein